MKSKVKMWGTAAAVLLLLIGGVWWMNRSYDKVSQPGYQFAMALMSVCNRKDAARLQVLVSQMRAAQEAGELPDYDAGVLFDIADRAAADDWESATAAVRRLMEDQVMR